MTVRELVAKNAMDTQKMYVVRNGETIAAFCKRYMRSIQDWIMNAPVDSYHAIPAEDEFEACVYIYINEVSENGTS